MISEKRKAIQTIHYYSDSERIKPIIRDESEK